MDWEATWLTLRIAGLTTLSLALLGMPLAYFLATTRWRWRFVLEAIVALPIVLPPTVVGYYLLICFAPETVLGRAYQEIFGSRLPFSFAGILCGSVLYNLPFAVRPFITAFAAVDRRLVETAWCLGCGRIPTIWRVVIPNAWAGLLAGLVLTFAHTVGEFGVVLMLGGNIPGVTRTLSIVIYDKVQALDFAAAGETSAALLVFAFVALSITYLLERRGPTK